MMSNPVSAMLASALLLSTNSLDDDGQILSLSDVPPTHCDFNRVQPSADGRSFVLDRVNARFQDEREMRRLNELVVFSGVGGFGEAPPTRPKTMYLLGSKSSRLRPLFWSDGKLTIRSGAGRLYSGKLLKGWHFEEVKFPEVWKSFELTINSKDGLSLIYDAKVIQNARVFENDSRFKRRSAYLSKTANFSVVDITASQSLLAGSEINHMSSLGLSSYLFNFNIIESSSRESITFLGSKNLAREYSLRNSFIRPIVDYRSGDVVGAFRPDRIKLGNSDFDVSAELKSQGGLILDAAYTKDRVFALIDDGLTRSVFVFNSNRDTQFEKIDICELKKESETEWERDINPGITLSKDSGTIGTLYKNTNKPTLGVILYYHGGPAVSSNPYRIPRELRKSWEDGYDILAIDYSGSVGGGLALSNELMNGQKFGFQKDADAVRNWLSTKQYTAAHVFAVSFGTLPAMVFASQYGEMLDRRIFAAPLLKHPSQKVLENPSRLFRIAEGSQFQFEKGLFGSKKRRENYISFITDLANNYEASQDDLFIFGKYDKITPIESAPAHILESAKVLTVRRDHRFLIADTSTLNEIHKHLSDEITVLK